MLGSFDGRAQEKRSLTLPEAIRLGLASSKTLKLSQAKIDEATAQFDQLKDQNLPSGKASYAYSHAEIPVNTLEIGGGNPVHLPSRADAFIGMASLSETVLDAHRLRYAKEAQDLMIKIAKLDAETNRDEVAYAIINAYYNLYKVQQSLQVVQQNLDAADSQLKQATRFFEQGIVTKNDVLRFQLEKSNVEVTGADLEANRKVVNYDMNLLLGLPETTQLSVTDFLGQGNASGSLAALIDSALANRGEIRTAGLRTKAAESAIKSLHADQYPVLALAANMYYVNAGGKILPEANSFILPVSVGATLAWNFDKLWMNKNKIAEAKIRKSEAEISRSISADRIKSEVNRNFQNYQTALERIRIYETSVAQATENDKILESKYRNNIASVTDRIDAQSQLFQTRTNLELAKADAALAWYAILKSTGTLPQTQTN
jgi:outer membrane protein TolC